MELLSHFFLSTLIFLPALAAMAIMALRRWRGTRWIALAATVLTFIASLSLLVVYDWHIPANGRPPIYVCRDASHPTGVVQFVQRVNIVRVLHLQYFVGIDGLSLPLVLLTGFMSVRACVAAWTTERRAAGAPPSGKIAEAPPIEAIHQSNRLALLLLLESALLGTFLSLNFALFVFFLAISILPVALLLNNDVGPGKRHALFRLVAMMSLGIFLLLIAMIAIYRRTGEFDLIALPAILRARLLQDGLMNHFDRICFALLMAAFLIRMAVVPFHRWLSDLYAEAPAPLGMMVCVSFPAGAAYGVMRIAYPLLPDAARSSWKLFAIVGIISIFYGALTVMAQRGFRRLIACLSVYQMGLILLGIAMQTPTAMNGATFMLVSHGLICAALLALAGAMVGRKGHDDLDRSGIAGPTPILNGYIAVVLLAVAGLPMLCGFVGELLVLSGTFAAANAGQTLRAGGWADVGSIYCIAILGCAGTILLPGGLLWKFRRILFAPADADITGADLTQREMTVLTPMLAGIFLLGILPGLFYFAFTRTTIEAIFRP